MKFKLSVLVLVSLLSLSAVLVLTVNRASFATPLSCSPSSPTTFSGYSGGITASNGGWSLTITGCNFGTYPSVNTATDGSVTTQGSNTQASLLLADVTSTWGAGFGGDLIGIFLPSGSWSNTQFVVDGFGNYGVCEPHCSGSPPTDFQISPGDQIYIYMIKPGCTVGPDGTTLWPSDYPSTPPPDTNWPTNCLVTFQNPSGGVRDYLGPITVTAPTTLGVPQFPLGLVALLGIAVPALVFLRRSKISIKSLQV